MNRQEIRNEFVKAATDVKAVLPEDSEGTIRLEETENFFSWSLTLIVEIPTRKG